MRMTQFCIGILILFALFNNPLAADFIHLRKDQHQIFVEVASTPAQRSRGLMGRKEMAEDKGMLFILDTTSRQCFWMRNTFIPLTIAYLDQDFKILQMSDMTPLSDTLHCAEQPATFALEVNQGWFAERNIGVGDFLQGSLP